MATGSCRPAVDATPLSSARASEATGTSPTSARHEATHADRAGAVLEASTPLTGTSAPRGETPTSPPDRAETSQATATPPAADSVPLLETRDLSRDFAVRRGFLGRDSGTVRAVDAVNLTLPHHATLGLVGESGCGKSTLARMVARLLQPSSGDLLLEGRSLIAPEPDLAAALPRRIQMIFQDPFSSLNPRLRVGKAVAEPLWNAPMPRAEREARVAEMLRLVGLSPDLAARYPHEFSGGQRQRVAIARALLPHPDLVICDEAVSALDASVQAQVLNLLRDVQDQFGLSYLFISHDLGVVGYMSDVVAVMYLGRVVERAPTNTLFDGPRHPYTVALLEAAPVREPGRARPPFLPGDLPSPLKPPPGCAFHPRCPKAQPLCREERPLARLIGPEHEVACHLA